MQYFYDSNAGEGQIKISGEDYKYLFRVKRLSLGDLIDVRNLRDKFRYSYQISGINRKDAILRLKGKVEDMEITDDFHIGWCVIDPKTVEKNIHILNELGVSKISFIYCERSQKNFKPNLTRLKKILINSSMQCGRGDIMELEVLKNLYEFVEIYQNFTVIDFGSEKNGDFKASRILVGAEGGFTDSEKEAFCEFKKLSFQIKSILRSETAVICATSKILA